jgi:hypothetical protein
MKTFYTAEDIESFAERGQTEILVDENVVLTDLAKHTADMLGVRLAEKPTGLLQTVSRPVHTQTAATPKPLSGKPKGCQARPKDRLKRAGANGNLQSKQIVDRLVDAVKRQNSN